MKCLLDTHAILWAFGGDDRLSSTAADAFVDPANELYFSLAGYWEVCIKLSLGKLGLAENWVKVFDREMAQNEIQWLAVSRAHVLGILGLPYHHRDPFDRVVISQAQIEGLTIVTADAQFASYDVPVLW